MKNENFRKFQVLFYTQRNFLYFFLFPRKSPRKSISKQLKYIFSNNFWLLLAVKNYMATISKKVY